MFTNQKQFFEKIKSEKNKNFENNLCWLINIFIILKNFWINISEKEIYEKALEINAYQENFGWKYEWLIKIFNYFNTNKNIKIKIFDPKFFHNTKLEKIFFNWENCIFIASIALDENHLIIIEKVKFNNIYYKSVWTKNFEAKENWVIKINDFFKIYNKRWILIEY
jgi:hypothetical protein